MNKPEKHHWVGRTHGTMMELMQDRDAAAQQYRNGKQPLPQRSHGTTSAFLAARVRPRGQAVDHRLYGTMEASRVHREEIHEQLKGRATIETVGSDWVVSQIFSLAHPAFTPTMPGRAHIFRNSPNQLVASCLKNGNDAALEAVMERTDDR